MLELLADPRGLRVDAGSLWDQTDYRSVPNIPE